jgi:hypothetical protein
VRNQSLDAEWDGVLFSGFSIGIDDGKNDEHWALIPPASLQNAAISAVNAARKRRGTLASLRGHWHNRASCWGVDKR